MARLYSFVNSYLSDIQRGLQTAHLVNEMWLNYGFCADCGELDLLSSWAHLGKTIVILNGGNHEDLHQLNLMFFKNPNHYPFAHFYEDRESLNGSMTAVGIILPEQFNERCDREYIIQIAGDERVGLVPKTEIFNAQMAELLIHSHSA